MVAPVPSNMGPHCLDLRDRKEDQFDIKGNSKSLEQFLKTLPNKEEITEVYTFGSFLSKFDFFTLAVLCPNITKLNLTCAFRVNDEAVKVIAESFKQLKELNLQCANNQADKIRFKAEGAYDIIGKSEQTDYITDKGIEDLLSRCRTISKLDITGCDVTFETFKTIVASPHLSHLVFEDGKRLRKDNYEEFKNDIQLLLSLRQDLTFIDENGEHIYSPEKDPFQNVLSSSKNPTVGKVKKEEIKKIQPKGIKPSVKKSAVKKSAVKKSAVKKSAEPKAKAPKIQPKKTGLAARIIKIALAPARSLLRLIANIFSTILVKLHLKKPLKA